MTCWGFKFKGYELKQQIIKVTIQSNTGVSKLFLAMYPFSILIDKNVPLNIGR